MKSFPRFPGLDGLRGIAVLALCGHASGIPGFASGDRGQEVFFVLTGFLSTAALMHECDAMKSIRAGRFHLRRAARILPALAALLVALLLVTLAGVAPWSRPDFLRSLPFAATCSLALQAELGEVSAPLRHLEVLTWGVLGYLALPPVLAWASRAWTRMRLVSRACLIGFGLCVVARLLVASGHAGSVIHAVAGSRFDGFGLGVLCAIALRRGYVIPRRMVIPALPVLLACFAVPASPALAPLGTLFATMATAVLIGGSAGARASRFMHALDAFPLGRIGTVAFGVYLWHPPLVLVSALLPLPEGLRWAVCLGAAIAVAALSRALIERPVLNRIDAVLEPVSSGDANTGTARVR